LIQLKIVLGFQKSPYFLTSQFNPPSWHFNHFKINLQQLHFCIIKRERERERKLILRSKW